MAESAWQTEFISDLSRPHTPEVTPIIFRVPAALSRVSPGEFEATALPLGLHGRKPYSEGCEEFKVTLARALLLQGGTPGQAEDEWRKVANRVVSNPQYARSQYERRSGGVEEGCLDERKLDDAAVASMLALDAICIVAFLQVSAGLCAIEMWEVVLREPRWWGLLNAVETDLAMVQNQVPMSCLKGAVWAIMDSVKPQSATEGKVVEELEALLRHGVFLLYPLAHAETLPELMKTTFCGSNALVHCKHFLDCLYRVLSENLSLPLEKPWRVEVSDDESDTAAALYATSSSKKRRKRKKKYHAQQLEEATQPTDLTIAEDRARIDSQTPVMSAYKLKTLGIIITSRPCRLSEISFIHGSFWNSELLLPQLKVYDSTAVELRNLAVYEFLQYPWHGHVRKYLRFMNDLVSDTTDARILVRSGAIANYVGGLDEIVNIWSGLNQCIPLPPSSSDDASVWVAEQGIRKHCRQFQGTCLADIRSKLFGRPTLFFSAVFALILLLLTFVQTYLTIVNSSKWHL